MANPSPQPCRWIPLREALRGFVLAEESHQGSAHIRGVHWYVACRLVLEGGFHPDTVSPRPPFRVEEKGARRILHHDPSLASWSEATILGGLKTKNVDVVISLKGIGPCVAVSMKGSLNAFRNLTNRLEEAVGDCTNLHIAYPALVYGFVHLLRANREGPIPPNGKRFLKPDPKTALTRLADVAVRKNDAVSSYVSFYHAAMLRLTERLDLRDDPSRYEAVTLVLVSPEESTLGEINEAFPPKNTHLRFDRFFSSVYSRYDLRFVTAAPSLASSTRRLMWDEASPALSDSRAQEFPARVGVSEASEEDEESS